MRRYSLLVLPLALLLVAGAPKDDQSKKDLKQFEGTWKIVSVEQDGKKLADDSFKDIRMVVKGNQYAVKRGNRTAEQGTFKIDATKKPRTIDVTPTEGEGKGKTYHGIYEIQGDTARDCFAAPGKDRPTTFATKSGSGFVLRVYKRVKS
jgi:uncharacterized protein (TIGR03067 family)